MTGSMPNESSIAASSPGLVDLHFDLPLGLLWNQARRNVLATDFLPQFEAGGIGLISVAIYVEDKFLPNQALGVGLDQVALLYRELEATPRIMLSPYDGRRGTARRRPEPSANFL